jgi:hypothetical protein
MKLDLVKILKHRCCDIDRLAFVVLYCEEATALEQP